MREVGIDLANRTSAAHRDLAEKADVVVATATHAPPSPAHALGDLPGPTNRPIDEVRAARGDIAERIDQRSTRPGIAQLRAILHASRR
jgi:hypothetical protein